MVDQALQGLGLDARGGRAGMAPHRLAQQVLDQQRDVLAALAQRRHDDMDDVEPVQQVVAEAALADERLEVAVGGGDHARAGAAHGAGAERAELAAVEHAQQLGLAGERQLADLVEEEAARARELEQALAVRARAGEGAALVAEELALDQLALEQAAVDRHIGLARAPAPAVQRRGHHLLAGAALAGEQHRHVEHRRAPHLLEHLQPRRAVADHAVVVAAAPALNLDRERVAAACECAAFERARDHEVELGELVGLGEVVEGAQLHRRDRAVDAAVAGEHHDLGARRELLDALEQLDAVHARHLDVDEGELHAAGLDAAQCAFAVAGLADAVALAAEAAAEQLAVELLVVDDQDVAFVHGWITHPSPLPLRPPPAAAPGGTTRRPAAGCHRRCGRPARS